MRGHTPNSRSTAQHCLEAISTRGLAPVGFGAALATQHPGAADRGLFLELRALVAGRRWAGPDADSAAAGIPVPEDEACATAIVFDDADTGIEHYDAPFVHHLEAMALLTCASTGSVGGQRVQAQAHLDLLMRHKYAYEVALETEVERTVRGLLIDRGSRKIVSEVLGTDTLSPEYPCSPQSHPAGGACRGACRT